MRRRTALLALVAAVAALGVGPARADGPSPARRIECSRGYLGAGAATEAISPTTAQVAGEVEARAVGLGQRRQQFHLGGFGVNPFQALPDPDGSFAAALTRPAARPRYSGSQGPEDIRVRAMVLRAPGGPTVALVTLDATGAGNVVQDRITRAIERATGIPAADVLLSETHTHAGPDLQGLWGGVPQSWVRDVLVPGAVRAVRGALADLRAVTLEERHGRAAEFNSYRRPKLSDPGIDTDAVATLLDARDAASGDVVASLLQFNAHPTTVREATPIPHPDFVLGALDWLERRGGVALYVNGPIADASSSGSRPGCAYPADGTYGRVRCRGEGIAAAALAFPRGRVLAPTLQVRHTTVVLPVTNPLFVAAGASGAFNRYYDFLSLPVEEIPGIGEAAAGALVDLPQVVPIATAAVTRITIGGARAGLELVTIPGEATGTYGDDIRALASPRAHVALLGLTHASLGYIIPEDEFTYVDPTGGTGFLLPFTSYEEMVSLGPLTAPLLRTQAYAPLFDAGSASIRTPSGSRSIVIPSHAQLTRSVPSPSPQRPRASARSSSTSPSVWEGSWWKSTSRSTSAFRAKATT